MNPTLIFAVVSILTAAVIYTIAVFSERASGILKPWHLALFWTGLVFDTLGTTLMSEIAGGWRWDLHGVIGAAAIVLMLGHSVWATIALLLKNQRILKSFHTFSLHVWVLWMVALGSGIVMTIVSAVQRTGAGG